MKAAICLMRANSGILDFFLCRPLNREGGGKTDYLLLLLLLQCMRFPKVIVFRTGSLLVENESKIIAMFRGENP